MDLRHLPRTSLDEWATQHRGYVRDVGAFLSRAPRDELTGDGMLPDRRRWAPATFLATQERWALAQRLLHDDDLPAGHRLAGAPVLLYGQPVRRQAALRRSSGTTYDGRTTVSLGSEALLLAPPLDQLARELATGGRPEVAEELRACAGADPQVPRACFRARAVAAGLVVPTVDA